MQEVVCSNWIQSKHYVVPCILCSIVQHGIVYTSNYKKLICAFITAGKEFIGARGWPAKKHCGEWINHRNWNEIPNHRIHTRQKVGILQSHDENLLAENLGNWFGCNTTLLFRTAVSKVCTLVMTSNFQYKRRRKTRRSGDLRVLIPMHNSCDLFSAFVQDFRKSQGIITHLYNISHLTFRSLTERIF